MKHLLLILPFITQWSFFNNGELVLTADETSLDSVTVDMRLTEDLTFALRQTRTSLIISPSDNDRTYMWQIVDRNSLDNMAQMVGRKSITPEEFWQYYIYLFFDSRYDLDRGTVELNYADYAITPGSYDVVIAGCDSLGYRTSEFTIRHINVRTTAPEKLYAAEPASTDTLYYFLLWKDGRQVAELPSTSVDSITVRQVTKPVNLDLAVTDVGKTRATISVTPSYPVPYYFDYLPASVFETYPDDETFVSQYLEFLKAIHLQDLESILSYEPDSYTFTEDDELASGTDYYAFAFAVNMADTTYVPYIAKQKFTTLQQSFIDGFTFSFEYQPAGNRVQITPSIDDQTYVWSIWPENEVKSKYGGSPERAWIENAAITAGLGFIDTGVSYCNLTYECLWPGTYYLTVAGYDHGQTSPVAVYVVTVD